MDSAANERDTAMSRPAAGQGGLVRPLLAAVAGWALAGCLVGAWVAAATIGINDSIRAGGDSLIFGLWTALFFALALAALGVAGQTLLLIFSRGLRWPGAPSAAAHLVAGILFCVTASIIARIAYLPAIWPDDRNMRLVVVAVGALMALGAALVVLRIAQPKRGPRALRTAMHLLAIVGIVAAFMMQQRIGAARAFAAFTPSQATPEWTGRRVFLIGIDGAEWSYINYLKAEGRIPNIAKLVDGGVVAPLRTTLPTYSPIIWTTIATGVNEQTHGVHDFVELRIPGMERGVQRLLKYPELVPSYTGMRMFASAMEKIGLAQQVPITAAHRRVKALWNIFSEHDVPVGVVNYFATYPADTVHGFLVSDRFGFNIKFGAADVPAEPGKVFPPDLAGRLGAPLELPAGLAKPEDFFRADVDSPTGLKAGQKEFDILRIGLDTDRLAASAAVRILDDYKVEFLALYMWGIDYNSHRLLKRFPSVIPKYYEYMDYLIGQVIARADDKTTIVMVSDHGWGWRPDEQFSHFHAPPGVLIMNGAGLRAPGELSASPHIMDIAPTILALAGFPIPRDMQGQVISEALSAELRARQEGKVVETYGRYLPPSLKDMLGGESTREGDAEAIERLRALGYVD